MSAGVKWVVTWFFATCLPALFPFAVVVFVGLFSTGWSLVLSEGLYLPLFERLTGLGQLLPTGLAFMYAASKDFYLGDAPARQTLRGRAIYGITFVLIVVVLMMLVTIQMAVLQGQGSVPYDTQQWIAWWSLFVFALCVVMTVAAVYLTTPAPVPAPAPASPGQPVAA
ncbi:hypothetical protein [Mycolicibacterium sp.]|uniref:hypothetical protein n=1 Tax=Mycolicibacterium sp. TaxID=2320850 RepID=UPI0037C60458